jgi:membrane associated rhomboid family serine protease
LAIVLGAFFANLATAAIEEHDFASVGASTATFAALGLLAGLQAIRRLRGGTFDKRRAWISVGAGLALFAMLGVGSQSRMSTGPGVDVWGHLTGLGFGVLLGLALGAPPSRVWLDPKRWSDRAIQVGSAMTALGFLAFAWWRALRG